MQQSGGKVDTCGEDDSTYFHHGDVELADCLPAAPVDVLVHDLDAASPEVVPTGHMLDDDTTTLLFDFELGFLDELQILLVRPVEHGLLERHQDILQFVNLSSDLNVLLDVVDSVANVLRNQEFCVGLLEAKFFHGFRRELGLAMSLLIPWDVG